MTTVPDNIDDLIEAWHVSDDERELHEYLGWTWDEYRAWGAGNVSADGVIMTVKVE